MNLYILYLPIYTQFLISDWALLPLDPITSFAAVPRNAHSCYFLLLVC
jgi:hypothetical protein